MTSKFAPLGSSESQITLTGYHARLRLQRDGVKPIFEDRSTADALMINHRELASLADQGVHIDDLPEVSPERPLGAVSTMPDSYLKGLDLHKELEPVIEVEPHWYAPFDVPTYKNGDMDPDQRTSNLDDYYHGVRRATKILREANCRTRVLPLLKGVYADELRECYEVIEPIANGYVGVHVSQFFGPTVGNRINQCKNWLLTIDSVCDPEGIILIGLASPNYLADFPASVIGAAGRYQWLRATNFLQLPVGPSRINVRKIRTDINSTLGSGYDQTSINSFTKGEIHG